jgi:bifunctional oligoribonuclease and PAP phosphatase NrnA
MNPEILSVLGQNNSFVLTTHVNPDGDGIGSEIALAEFLALRKKEVRIINVSPTPLVYRFLDPHGRIEHFDEATHRPVIATAQVIAVLDTNHPDRLRAMAPAVEDSTATKICIDHHLDPSPFAGHYLIDNDATSTGEIVFHLLTGETREALPPLIAQALYAAIMTDTGSFRYPRTDPAIHEVVARLIAWGADPVQIYREIYERWSPGRIRLLGKVLASLMLAHNGKLAAVTVTREALQSTGTTGEDTDNFTVYPMSVDGVLIGILFLEQSDGLKISFRSRGNIPVSSLAREFGGNGHLNAAGAYLRNGALATIYPAVIDAAQKYLKDQHA